MARRPAKVTDSAPAAVPHPPQAWLKPSILGLLGLLLVACFSTEVSDSDTFWHLATGKYVLQQHRLPAPDPFAWATYLGRLAYPGEEHARYFNLTHEWLAQIWFYIIYAIGGYPGMVLARALLTALICGGIGLIVWRRTGEFYRAIAAPLIVLAVQYDSPVMDRPLLLTLVLLTAAWIVLDSGRRLWLLPPLFLLWGNAHGAYIMGWALLGAYTVEGVLRRDRRLLLPAAVSILASGLNPNGFRALQVLLLYQRSALQATLIEWTPPALWPPQEPFTVVLYAALVLLLWARSKARLADWLVYLFFAASAARASRNIVFLSLAGALMIATYFPWRFAPWKRGAPRYTHFAAAALLLAATLAQLTRGRSFELRAAEWRFPSGAATFLHDHHIKGRMFNIYGAGGYLIWRLWPEQRVMIDGRALNEAVNRDAMRIINSNIADAGGKSYEQLLDEYGIEVIVAEGFEYYTGRPWWLPVNLATLPQKEWKLVFRDPSSVVFMRRPPAGVTPLNPSDALLSFEDQCTLHLARDPQWPGCASGLARVFAGIRDIPRARKWGGIYLSHQSNPDPADIEALRQLH